MCAKEFRGAHHYLGGRFVPPEIVEKYGLVLPKYPGSSMCVKLDNVSRDVSNIRKTYATEALTDIHMHENPMDQFAEWFELAKHCKNVEEPNAMAVASVNSDAQPSVRVVLLRGFSDHGFVYYTNYESRKGKDFEGNPKVAATFYWEPLGMSVRIEGRINKLSAADSDEYWASRPREHQIGALSSAQSSIIESSEQLLKSYESVKDEYSSQNVIPRPSWWGGYIIQPHSIEFWKGRASRLHDRVIYTADSKTTDPAKHWVRSHLSP
jgi:NAD(P)H-hydrate epimerase